jgi:hypothetical protein
MIAEIHEEALSKAETAISFAVIQRAPRLKKRT